MKTQFQLRSIITVFTTILLSNLVHAQTPPVMQWSTHLDCHDNGVTNSKDWVLKLNHTKDGGYIGCGFSNSGTISNTTLPTLYRLDPNGNVVWQKSYDLGLTLYQYEWSLSDVIEDANGFFAAVGNIGIPGQSFAILLITDQQGTLLNGPSAILHLAGYNLTSGAGVAATPDGKYVITAWGDNGGPTSAFIAITNGYSTNPMTLFWQYPSPNEIYLGAIKIGTVNSTSNYDIVAVGHEKMSSTPISGCRSCEAVPCHGIGSATTRNIDVASVNFNGASIVTNWTYQSTHGIFTSNYVYDTDYGPYSLSTISSTHNGSHCTGCDYSSDFYDQMILNSSNDVGSDILINSKGEVVVAAFTDFLWPDDDTWYSALYSGIHDCSRGCLPNYDEYKDANCWLLKLDYNTGGLIPPAFNGSKPNPSHVAHFSGDDFRTQIGEDGCGNIFVIGSTADNEFGPNSSDLLPPAHYADMLLCKVDQYFSKIWRKHFSSSGLTPLTDNCFVNYDYDCGFGLVVNNDNSVTVAGNNGENGDDAVFTKLSSDEQTEKTWDYMTGFTAPVGPSTFPGGAGPVTFKGTLLVPAGAILTIDGTEIQFAETKEVVDYNNSSVNTLQCGIVVAAGGHLIMKNNALLRGLAIDPNKDCSRNYMWDGITVVGDPNKPQNITYQGWVEINTGSKIQDANAGIRFDSKTWLNRQTADNTNPERTWDKGHLDYNSSEGHGGGYVYAIDAKFLNNAKDIEFLPYHFNNNNNISIFNNCELKCNDVLADPDRLAWDVFSGTNIRVGVDAHVTMFRVYGIKYIKCLFSGYSSLPDGLRGFGIRSIDANYSINGTYVSSRFDNLTFGINATGISGNNNLTIENSAFADNVQAIVLQGNDLSAIKNNKFYVPKNSQYNFATGIYTIDTRNFNIYGNEFWSRDIAPNSKNYAIVVDNSNNFLSTIFKNITHDFRTATQYQRINGGLDIQCNAFNKSLTDWAIVNGNVNRQGVCVNNSPVHNIFTPAGACTGIVNIDNTLGTANFYYDSWSLCTSPPNCVVNGVFSVFVSSCNTLAVDDPCILVPGPKDKFAHKGELQQSGNQLAADPESEALTGASKKGANAFAQIIAAANDTSPGNEATLYSAVLTMNNNNHDYFTLSTAEKISFCNIANGADVGAVKAQQILDWNNGALRLRKPLDFIASARQGKSKETPRPAPTQSVRCYPNPATNQLTVQFDESIPVNNGLVELLSPVTGTIIKSVSISKNSSEVKFDVSDLSNGIYLIRTTLNTAFVDLHKIAIVK